MTTAQNIIDVARSQIGYVETPSNITRYWAELEPGLQGNPWCAAFVSWVFKHAGMPLPAMGKTYGYVYVPNAVNYAKAHGLWDASGHYAPGDVVCYGNGAHTGIIATDDGTTMAVYEGNTSPDNGAGSQTNGGGVYLRHRPHGTWVNGVVKTSRLLTGTSSTPHTAPAAPSRTQTRPPIAKPARVLLAVDGDFGPLTRKRFQQWAGVTQDGDLGPISWRAIQRKVGSPADGIPGPNTWKAIQRMVSAVRDGIPGPDTYRHLQIYLNSH